ncbi:hypothetical protein JHK82_029341 [Glycine max]|uniref:Uncharacterized protein n=1 Tax=Glycine max TaxID=3847 RepID=K7LLP2_SOYBN|nr:hypothetical protein JHK85_029990 [Glycine max]KAG5005317.1 hypothetical protein JHK86_029456 [Glycine max]KAG5128506.1 hypothetical protein JHK82_029341 [Glycine max]KAH1140278.1 hypothetical protein GYH30_029261 [Glycine max]KRH35864.1 hypothetical protein GLYMA_10G269100v4 [Glycine max]
MGMGGLGRNIHKQNMLFLPYTSHTTVFPLFLPLPLTSAAFPHLNPPSHLIIVMINMGACKSHRRHTAIGCSHKIPTSAVQI